MRHGTPNRRSRNNRGHSNGGGHNNGQRRGPSTNRNQIFDSNGPDVRIRGTAHQVCEKYLTLAKDAASVGDIVLAESYLQHAEHYQRIINSWGEEFRDVNQNRPQNAYAPPPQQEQSVEDDLSLPISILGGDVKLESREDVRETSPQNGNVLETA